MVVCSRGGWLFFEHQRLSTYERELSSFILADACASHGHYSFGVSCKPAYFPHHPRSLLHFYALGPDPKRNLLISLITLTRELLITCSCARS